MKKSNLFLVILLFSTRFLYAERDQEVSVYLTSQKLILNKIDSINPETTRMFDSIFWAKWDTHQNTKVAFHEAMCSTLSKSEYYYKYFKEDIEQRAWVILNDDLNYYKNSQKLSESSINSIKPFLEQRSKEIAFIENRYFTNSTNRAEAIKNVQDTYRDKISQITLKNNSSGASYNLGLVLENRKKLKLTEIQVDSIISASLQVLALQQNGVITKEKNNRWEYERKFILKFLNEEQVSDFLSIRNFDYANDFAKKRWKEIEENNIAFEYDSTQVINEIIAYQLNKEKIKYIYKEDSEKQKEMDDYLYKNSYPKALKHLRIEKRKNTNQDVKDKDDLIL